MSMTALAGSDSDTGSIGNNQRVSASLSVSRYSATTNVYVVGYPDLLTTVRAEVVAHEDTGSGTQAKPSVIRTGSGTISATYSVNGVLIAKAYGYGGTSNVPKAVELQASS